MATRPPRICPRCGTPVREPGPCPVCTRGYRREGDARRGSSEARGYGREHRERFRRAVLERDPVCTCTDPTCPAHPGESRCRHLSTVADHWPQTKRELRERGLDDNDPCYGRGLCEACHAHATATDARTLGGWYAAMVGPPR